MVILVWKSYPEITIHSRRYCVLHFVMHYWLKNKKKFVSTLNKNSKIFNVCRFDWQTMGKQRCWSPFLWAKYNICTQIWTWGAYQFTCSCLPSCLTCLVLTGLQVVCMFAYFTNNKSTNMLAFLNMCVPFMHMIQ